jgi:hypothetical protein
MWEIISPSNRFRPPAQRTWNRLNRLSFWAAQPCPEYAIRQGAEQGTVYHPRRNPAPRSAIPLSSKEEGIMTKREEIAPHGDRRYVRRDTKGQFKSEVDEGKSLSADRLHKADRQRK